MNSLSNTLTAQPHFHKWIIHLYQQAKRRRLSLICGAGISIDAGVPLWKPLVQRIARKIERMSEDSIAFFANETNPTYLTQIAYGYYISPLL